METDRAEALELSKGLEASASNIERVSKKASPSAAHWAFEQWKLRARASKKGLPRAEQLLFHWDGLEQSTHFSIAQYHASLFPAGVLVADLTTGNGSDLIALAQRGPVIGFETNPEKLEYARHNLSVLGLQGELVLGDCLEQEWNFEYAYGDPSRRLIEESHGYRLNDMNRFQPNPLQLARRMKSLRLGLMKMSPMIQDDILKTLGSRIDFLSLGRECREALIYLGDKYGGPGDADFDNSDQEIAYRLPVDMIGDPVARFDSFAIQVESREELASSSPPSSIEVPMAFLYEADPAAIRAHGLGTLAKQHSLAGLGDSNGYLTSESSFQSVWLTSFRVHGHGHFDKKALRGRLRELGGGTPIVKSRSKGIDVVQLRKDLTMKGSVSPIVAIYPVGLSLRYAVLERL